MANERIANEGAAGVQAAEERTAEVQASQDSERAAPGPRRALGDAWRDWDPVRDATAGDTRAAPAFFLLLATLLAVVSAGLIFGLFWLAEPRLLSLSLTPSAIRAAAFVAAALAWGPAASLWILLLGFRPPRWMASAQLAYVIAIWTLVRAAAGVLHISRDRLGHAYVLLLNQLAPRARRIPAERGLLVLAPRCLRADVRRQLQELAASAGAQFEIVGGGEQALATLASNPPGAVLAVACERDLVAGMRDVAPSIAVLGLPNRRPEGPCRNSEIDLEEAGRMLAKLRGLVAR